MSEIIYGIHVIEACLQQDCTRFIQVYVMECCNSTRLKFLVVSLKEKGIPVKFVKNKILDNISNGGVHQGIIARIQKKFYNMHIISVVLQKPDPIFLILDGITDPRNFGACFRSACAAGVNVIIAPKNRSARLNAVAKKVSSGAAERVPLVRVTNLSRTLLWLKKCNVWMIGTSPDAGCCLYNVRKVHGALGLIVGSENKGMRYLTKKHCDEIVSIPMFGGASSVNVSVAVGICLFEFVRKRKYT
ncbi:MAG: 23S rRNA 2'-O-ribose methyltransferase [Candidatus Westeberhardia cardiocondylae]|nr:23S rRNA 2'-O-ribose methyltransferase [Candidatus Westeberhardia cardiocondylae]